MMMSPRCILRARSLTVWPVKAAGTMTHAALGTVSLPTKSSSEVVPIAPSPASSFTAAWLTSYTTHSWPSRMSLRTRLAPMRPSPIIPNCMRRSLPLRWSSPSPPRRPASSEGRAFPELDPPENARRVVHDGGLGAQIGGDVLGVPASDVHLVVEEQRVQGVDGEPDPLVPLLVPDPAASRIAEVLVVRFVLSQRVVRQLHVRRQPSVEEQAGADTGAQRHHQLEPLALHHGRALQVGVVDDLGRLAEGRIERGGEIEAAPRLDEDGHRLRAGARHGHALRRGQHR